MAFVNEYIPESDMEKYRIEEIDQHLIGRGVTHARDWTVDRERNMYLRNVFDGTFEDVGQTLWNFFWNGELILFKMIITALSGGRNKPVSARKRIVHLCLMEIVEGRYYSLSLGSSIILPERLESQKAQIFKDLEEALLAYKDGGVFATATSYELFLELGEGV